MLHDYYDWMMTDDSWISSLYQLMIQKLKRLSAESPLIDVVGRGLIRALTMLTS